MVGRTYMRGTTRVKEFTFTMPIPLYRGVWREGAYAKGDAVTFSGSTFIAVRDTSAQPEASKDWQLSIKRGRDGRDGKAGDRGPQGPKGDKGDQGLQGFRS